MVFKLFLFETPIFNRIINLLQEQHRLQDLLSFVAIKMPIIIRQIDSFIRNHSPLSNRGVFIFDVSGLFAYDHQIYIFVRFLIILPMRRVAILYYFRTNSSQTNAFFKCVNLDKDYYKVLEVQCGASENTIKRSYLKLVRKLHPDLNPSGHDKFTEVQEAYNILSDKKLKGYYDSNNKFYQPQPQTKQQENPRNQQFYNDMKDKYYQEFYEKADYQGYKQEEEPKESQEQAKQRRKFEDQIKLTRKILFTKNPIWEQANAYMNYEERQRRVEEKQKQFEALFPAGARLANSFKKWML